MLAKLTLFDGTVYRFSDRTVDTADGLYQGRIKEDIELSSRISENGSAPASINLTIINDDKTIPYNKDLWGAELLLTSDSGVKWTGKVVFSNFDADGNLYISASEKAAPELEYYMPDEVRQVYSVDENFHQSSVSMTIPMVIGGTHDKPVTLGSILIDKQNGIYLICVGEIREIVNVYNGAELLPSSAYTAYTGTSSQTDHKGFAYVQISEDYRKNSDGSYAEINVDVVGLKLANHTEAECRNPARFLYYFLTTAATGINGWGCGISASDIDTASFNSAMTLCDSLNYKLDGTMWMRQQAQSWINQICQTMHASYSINADGKRSLFIDYAGAASKKTFNLSNMKLSRYGKNAYTNTVYNKGVLTYGYNPITGLFMQSAQYDNQQSIDQIGEQKFVGESYLINDPATALSVLEYTCKKSQIQAEAIEFETDDLSTYLRAGDLITIDHDDISGLFQISNINTDSVKSIIVGNRFDPSIFVVGGSASRVDWQNERDITPAMSPAQATNLLLSTGFDINQDGTGNPYISGTFTVPEGGWLAAAVQYGIGANPTNFTELALITEGRFKIQPVNVGTIYTIRVRMITATGHSDYITGQITSTGDTVPPAIPTIVLNSTEKSVIVKCAIDNPPNDMGGFQIWRKKHTEEVFTLVGNVAANFGYASFPDHVETFVEYDYKAKSYDRSGNLSDFSQVVSIIPTGLEATELAATALKIPTGSILRLSAKGSDNTSILATNGVKDVSGYGHHGTAGSGVSIVDDNINGQVFSFGTTSGQGLSGFTLPIYKAGMTYHLKAGNITSKSTSGSPQIFRHLTESNSSGIIITLSSGLISVNGYDNNTKIWELDLYKNLNSTDWYDITITVSDSEGTKIYIDGEKVIENAAYKMPSDLNNIPLTINSAYTWSYQLCDIRIYPRALSATEIKSLYMMQEDAMFGQVTADLIGANAVNAIHINAGAVTANAVGTNEIITNTANISQAVVNNLNVSGNATFQAGLNGIQVGGRNYYRNSASWVNGDLSNIGPANTVTYEAGLLKLVKNSGSDAWFGRYESPKMANHALLTPGQTITISVEIKSDSVKNNAMLGVFIGSEYRYSQPTEIGTNWTKIIWTETWTDTSAFFFNSANLPNGNYWLGKVKLEEGTRATDWTPAPEDVEADATAKANAVQTNLNTVTNNIYTPNTTTINGGKITTGSIAAGAIAANAITAEKLNVEAIKKPASLYSWVSSGLSRALTTSDRVPDRNGHNGVFFKPSADSAITGNNNPSDGFAFNGNGRLISGILFSMPSVYSYRCRFKKTSSNSSMILDFRRYSGTYAGGSALYSQGAQIVYQYGETGNDYYIRTPINLNTWYDAVCTRNGNVHKLYLNGELIGQTNFAEPSSGGFKPVIGGWSGGSGYDFVGNIADVEFYIQELTDTEVKTLYMLGTDTESGQITADRIATDAVKSRNYAYSSGDFSTAGTFLDLANGAITSKNFCIKSDGSAKFKGNVEATSGKIGNWEIISDAIRIKSAISGTDYLTINSGYDAIPGLEEGFNLRLQRDRLRTCYYGPNKSIAYESYYSCTGLDSSDYVNSRYIALNSTSISDAANHAAMRFYGNGYSTSSYCIAAVGKIQGQIAVSSDEGIKTHKKPISTLNRLKQIRIEQYQYNADAINSKYSAIAELENTEIDNENKIIELENQSRSEAEKIPLKKHVEPFSCSKDEYKPKKIGAYAKEFNEMFGVNNNSEDDIMLMDTIGVALRAIQELAQQLDDLKRQVRSYKRILNITDEQIAEERDKTAIRRLEIAKARQAKRAIKEHESPIDLEKIDGSEGND